MGRYVARRLLQMIPVALGTIFVIYTLVWALPANPFAGKCGDRPCPDRYIAAMTERYNLDDHLIVQYGKYLSRLIQGDFGTTFSGVPVLDELARTYPVTVRLALLAIVIQIVIGAVAGVFAALRRGGYADSLVLVSTLAVISIPVFVIGHLMQLSLGVSLGIFPPTARGADPSWYSLLMPAMVLASTSLAYVARLMRTTLVENLRADYVKTATAKGMSRARVVGVHTVRNSMIPMITFLGADFGALLGGAIVTEGIFGIGGVGGLIFGGINRQEGAIVTGAVTVLVLVFLLVNLFVDMLYAALDPRIRYD